MKDENEETGPVWECVADGIYRNTTYKKPWLYERPIINCKRTFKGLGQTNINRAKEELARRVTERAKGNEPTAKADLMDTAGAVIRLYISGGYPDRWLKPRTNPDTLEMEARCCEMLLGFWDTVQINQCTSARCDLYRDWRVGNKTRSTDGFRMVDMELNTLKNAFRLAKRRDLVLFNPMLDCPKYHNPANVVHCRNFMPTDADEMHALIRPLFEQPGSVYEHPRSVVLGFQYMYEAMTGLRTEETLMLGTKDPVSGVVFGSLTECGKFMHVWRCKGQHAVNPYVEVHEGLKAVMDAHMAWRDKKYPGCTLFFPSPVNPSVVVGTESLAHALGRLDGKKLTSHGARAWFVTRQRSWGIADSVIAFQIGQTSGGATIAKVYGGYPAAWVLNGPKMAWLPKSALAWAHQIPVARECVQGKLCWVVTS
jgi:hypothetical protein